MQGLDVVNSHAINPLEHFFQVSRLNVVFVRYFDSNVLFLFRFKNKINIFWIPEKAHCYPYCVRNCPWTKQLKLRGDRA